jgi:MtfA peptidase
VWSFLNWRRNRWRARVFPGRWADALQKNFPLYLRLPPDRKKLLHGHIHVFLQEKTFEGCGGLRLTDEIRVTVAAQACCLLMGRDMDCFPKVRSILVYPKAYMAKSHERHVSGVVIEGEDVRSGESWHDGTVVLSWDDSRRGGCYSQDGENLVFHEFAHQIDEQYGVTEALKSSSQRAASPWHARMTKAYEDFVGKVEKGRRTALDPYGATNEAEFFAVATEFFFEKPDDLLREQPSLYKDLRWFYQQDPIRYWTA